MRFSRTPELLLAVRNDAQLEADFKANPVATLERVAQPETVPDTWLYRLVIIAFALSMFAAAGTRRPGIANHPQNSTNP